MAGVQFDITDHTGRIQIKPDIPIDPRYLVYALRIRINEEAFDRSFRASITNMSQFTVPIPTTHDGLFDLNVQEDLACQLDQLDRLRIDVINAKQQYDHLFQRFVGAFDEWIDDSFFR